MSRRSKTDDWSSLVIAGLARDCTAVPPGWYCGDCTDRQDSHNTHIGIILVTHFYFYYIIRI